MVDVCVNADNARVISRSANFRIDKPGYYWLTFSALGSGDGYGPRADNVTLTAIGGLNALGITDAFRISAPGNPTGSWIRRGRYNEIEVQVQ